MKFLTKLLDVWNRGREWLSLSAVGIQGRQSDLVRDSATRAGAGRAATSLRHAQDGAGTAGGQAQTKAGGQTGGVAFERVRGRWRGDAVIVALLSFVGGASVFVVDWVDALSAIVGDGRVLAVDAVLAAALFLTLGLGWFAMRRCQEVLLWFGAANEQLKTRTAVGTVETAAVAQSAHRPATSADAAELGRELHDTAGQQLTGATLLIESLRRRSEGKADPQSQTLIDDLAECVCDALHAVRSVSHALAKPGGEEGSEADLAAINAMHGTPDLPSALRETARRATRAFGAERRVRVRLDASVEDRFHDLALPLASIAREAITNAARHGRSEHIVIALFEDAGEGVLEVVDDGVGPDVRGGVRESTGLWGMRQRAASFGGEVELRGWSGSLHGLRGGGACLSVRWSADS